MRIALVPCLALAASVGLAGDATGIRTPGRDLPPVLRALGALDGSEIVAVSADGSRAAIARRDSAGKSSRTTLELRSMNEEENAALEISGEVRALLYSLEGPELYALRHKPAKKNPGLTMLIEIDPATRKSRELLRLPPSARGLAHWPERGAVFIACEDEVRTILLPGPRTGPLFSIEGANLSALSVGGSLVLLGQQDGIELVDVNDRSTREGLEPRDRVESTVPIVALAGTSDGSTILARSSEGRIFRIGLEPFSLTEDGSATALVQSVPVLASPLAPPPVAAAVTAPPVREELLPEAAPSEEPTRPQPEPAPETSPSVTSFPTAAATAVHETPAAVKEEAAPVAAPADPETAGGSARGRVTGPAAKGGISVVLLGPNNLLREARRIRPASDGRWSAEGLEPGRYRVQLEAGGDHAVVSDPSFVFVEIDTQAPTLVPEIRAVQIL